MDAGRSTADSAARESAFRLENQLEEHADASFRQCYAEHVRPDVRFAALVQQVASIVRRLPPQ